MASTAARPSTRVAVVALLGVAVLTALAFFVRYEVPRSNWLFSGHYALGFEDLHTRFRDIVRQHHGYNLYSNKDHLQYFTYPPAALLLFWPLSWVAFRVDVLAWTLMSLAAMTGAILIVWRAARPTPRWTLLAGSTWITLAAVMVFPVISIHLALGQLGMLLMLMLAADYLAVRGPAKGVLTGIAAAIKIYPAVFVVAWLWRREWRAAGTAVASAAATSAVAWALWPSATATFIQRQLFSGRELTHFLHNTHWLATSSSPYTVFFRSPFHGGSWASVVGWAASAAAVAVGLWAGQRLWMLERRASAFVMVMAASVLAGPVTWDHYYTFAPLLIFVVLENRERLIRGTAIATMVIYAVPWQLSRNESLSNKGLNARAVLIFVSRNALSFATIIMMLVVVYATRLLSQRQLEPVAPST